MMEGLQAQLSVCLGVFTLNVELSLGPGRVLAVVGPNGAGKSTLLRALAGLRRIDAGCIADGGVIWDEPSSGHFVDPARRSVGMLFQDYRLFPSMSARDNVAFGLRAHGVGRRDAERAALEWLERVGVANRAMARPAALSGGQSQRVALARALAPQPDVLLLDEPFAALDAQGRLDLRADLSDVLGAFTGEAVVVTHDPNDALALADELLVLEGGRSTDRGSISEAVRHPRSPFVARLLGLNLVRGQVGAGTATLGPFTVSAPGLPDGPVFACCRPEDVHLCISPQRDVVTARIGNVARLRDVLRVYFTDPPGLMADIPLDRAGPRPGSLGWVRVRDGAWDIYPARGHG